MDIAQSIPPRNASFASLPPDKRPIKPRSPELPTFDIITRHSMADNVVTTAIGNSVNLLFPAGERFFVRSVRHYMSQLSPSVREKAQGFFGQEGRHAQVHERVIHLPERVSGGSG